MHPEIVSGVWQAVPGAAALALFPILVRTSITSSNCFILSAPSVIVVIDPGADAAQIVTVSRVVTEALEQQPRPVIVLLTHCHQDHSQGAASLSLPEQAPVSLCLHAAGAQALERKDRELTFACYYPWDPEVCRVDSPIRLFSGDPGHDTEQMFGLTRGADVIELPWGDHFEREWLDLGAGERFEFYHSPGHSDCSISLAVGDLLFLGDLSFALNPGLCGIYGWDHSKLSSTIRKIVWLLKSRTGTICLPGHGWALSDTVMLANLEVMAATSAQMSDVTALSLERIASLKLHLDELLEEVSYLCTVISGQLLALCFWLESLEESSASASVLAAMDDEKIELNIADLRRFISDFTGDGVPNLTLILKGVQIISRLLVLIDDHALEGLVANSLLARLRGQLEDFLSMTRGLQFLSAEPPGDFNAVIEAYCRSSGSPDPDHEVPALQEADDASGFTRLLMRQIAGTSILREVRFDLALTPDSTRTNLGGKRVGHIVESLVEAMAACGQQLIRIHTFRESETIVMEISGGQPISEEILSRHRFSLYQRTLEWLGARLLRLPEGTFQMRLPAC